MSVPAELLKEFIFSLSGKAGTTVDAYQRELGTSWIGFRSALETAARSTRSSS